MSSRLDSRVRIRQARGRFEDRGSLDSCHLESNRKEARAHRVASGRARARIRPNTDAIDGQGPRLVAAPGSINRHQLSIPLSGHPGRKLRTSGPDVLIMHSRQHPPSSTEGGLEWIRETLPLTRDIECITARILQSPVGWQREASIEITHVRARRVSAHRVLDIHVRKRLHQKAILRSSDIAMRNQCRVCTVHRAAFRGQRHEWSVEEYGTKNDDSGPVELINHRLFRLLADFPERTLIGIGAHHSRYPGSADWISDVRACSNGFEHCGHGTGVCGVEEGFEG